MIRECNVSYHFFADDSQLHDAAEPLLVPSLVQETTLCIGKVSDWMKANKSKMNDEKTEIIPIGTNSILKKVRVSSTVISGCETFFSQKVRKLGVFLDQTLFLDCHITHLAKIMYLQLCRISRIRPFISVEAAKNSSLPLFCRSLTAAIHYWQAYATTNFRNSGDFKITQHG